MKCLNDKYLQAKANAEESVRQLANPEDLSDLVNGGVTLVPNLLAERAYMPVGVYFKELLKNTFSTYKSEGLISALIYVPSDFTFTLALQTGGLVTKVIDALPSRKN